MGRRVVNSEIEGLSGRAPRAARLLNLVNRNSAEPLYTQLFQGVRTLILEGALAPGSKLPSSRRLAQDLKVSRSTVVTVIEQLCADGWLDAKHGSGTYVAQTPPSKLVGVKRKTLPSDTPEKTPFSVGVPGLDIFPIETWNRLQAGRWRRMPRRALEEGHSAGWSGLRSALAAHLRLSRDIDCEPEQVIITNSARGAVYLAARVLALKHEQAWVEDPGYFGAKDALRAAGLDVVPVPLDESGLRVDEGMRMAPHARLAVVTSHCQFPTGVTLSAERRAELRAWARSASGWIIDNGYDSEIAFDGVRLSSIASENDDRVIYINSFNKVLFPSLRIGYLVVPKALVDQFSAIRGVLDGHSNVPNQMVLHDFIEQGHLDEHLRRCRDAYAERRAVLQGQLAHYLGDTLDVIPRDGGLHLLASVREPYSPDVLTDRARLAGIDLTSMVQFEERCTPERRLLFGYAGFSPAMLTEAVRRFTHVCGQARSALPC